MTPSQKCLVIHPPSRRPSFDVGESLDFILPSRWHAMTKLIHREKSGFEQPPQNVVIPVRFFPGGCRFSKQDQSIIERGASLMPALTATQPTTGIQPAEDLVWMRPARGFDAWVLRRDLQAADQVLDDWDRQSECPSGTLSGNFPTDWQPRTNRSGPGAGIIRLRRSGRDGTSLLSHRLRNTARWSRACARVFQRRSPSSMGLGLGDFGRRPDGPVAGLAGGPQELERFCWRRPDRIGLPRLCPL
jgi:hypothetical protein